jgi:Domain of unknown function (DUF4375)
MVEETTNRAMPLAADMNRVLSELSTHIWEPPFETLTPEERVFRAIWDLEAEVNNGGFNQYFFNSAGDNAQKAAAALRVVGTSTTAGVAENAIGVFGQNGPSADRYSRQEQLESLTESQLSRLEELDQQFYRYPDNLTELLYSYVEQNRSRIRGADRFFIVH